MLFLPLSCKHRSSPQVLDSLQQLCSFLRQKLLEASPLSYFISYYCSPLCSLAYVWILFRLPYTLYAAKVSSISWQSWKSLMISEHNRWSCPTCKRIKGEQNVQHLFKALWPALLVRAQGSRGTQSTHSLSQGMWRAKT